VPNIGVIGGTHSVLVIDTGMGPRNAGEVLEFATGYANGRRLSTWPRRISIPITRSARIPSLARPPT